MFGRNGLSHTRKIRDQLAGMDAELQALAERRTRELRRAYEDMLDRLS